MKPLFSAVQFFEVFRAYNEALWPAPVLLVALALLALWLALKPRRGSGAAVSAILGFLWAWTAIAYHLAFFTRISPAAYGFAALSMAGAAVFIWQGVFRRRLTFRWMPGPRSLAGAALTVFALLVYPFWSASTGHVYPATPTFGLPCPTTIFTIGVLAFAVPPAPRSPLLIPMLWCLVGAQAAFFLDVRADLGLIAAGLVGIALWVGARPRHWVTRR